MTTNELITIQNDFESKFQSSDVRIRCEAADFRMRLCWDDGNYHVELVDTSPFDASEKYRTLVITSQQAGAMLALFATAEDDFEKQCYEILGDAFNNVPNNLRPIP